MKTANSSELLFVVNDKNKPIEPLPRNIVHGSGIWHRTAHVIVIDSSNNVLCHLRSKNKDLSPGVWDRGFGGHLSPGETYKSAAKRELYEESGIKPLDKNLKFHFVYKYYHPENKNNEFEGVFTYRWSGNLMSLDYDKNEIDALKWFSAKSVINCFLSKNEDWAFSGYEEDLLNNLCRNRL